MVALILGWVLLSPRDQDRSENQPATKVTFDFRGKRADGSPPTVTFRVHNPGSRAILLESAELQFLSNGSLTVLRHEPLFPLGGWTPGALSQVVCNARSNCVFETSCPPETTWRVRVAYRQQRPRPWLQRVKVALRTRSLSQWSSPNWGRREHTEWIFVQDWMPTELSEPARPILPATGH